MTILIQEFYVFPEEIYRMGNTTSHRLTEIKPREVDITDFGGVEMIIANGRGVSLRTLDEIIKKGLSGWAWKFEKGTVVTEDFKTRERRTGPLHVSTYPKYTTRRLQTFIERDG